ncbi:reverse transcriptase family protein [Haliangium sp. UPWRP_2]|uniref:reverse transcriptase family protein n=1 Tax=Haliangium sp. UPWRP_2 TaxID=1931276 RepID=UPI000B543453|nr:reverse transcriptase family protein [Haliangium sp. UPWRP_2]PSM31930.1 RNA-directed DNA polymerase [Haliangium sp. UPWRP_2]HNN92376.1 reverse transcriptase family protein [Pseudomonadota bacterium]
MSLSALLLQLKPLLAAPRENLAAISDLLRRHRDLAEYEVARFWVSRAMGPQLEQELRSPDPRTRRKAAEAVRYACTRRSAGRLLRPLVKEADTGVAVRARTAMHALRLDDVALPDTRYPKPKHAGGFGGYNVTGWCFGLFPHMHRWWRKKANPNQAAKQTLLEKHGLPVLASEAELLSWLGLKRRKDLLRLLRPGCGTGAPYVEFSIPKASGGTRTISAPRASLKKIQRRILDEILAKLPTHAASHGFVRGRSVLSNAKPHVGASLVLKMDLRDFFPTIHFRRVCGLFCRIGYSSEVASLLAGLCTHRGKLADGYVVWPGVLPQGAPTSPAIANLLCRRLDARLTGLARGLGGNYTRYADDLTFSFKAVPERGIGRFSWWVDQVCQQEGFVENTGKRRVLRPQNQQRITGIVVNSGLNIPRAARHTFRALLHNVKHDGLAAQARGRKDLRAYLLGFASYVRMVQPKVGKPLLAEVRAVLKAAGQADKK